MSSYQVREKSDLLSLLIEYNWIRYLPSNRICSSVVSALKLNNYVYQAFGESMADYRRDDFNVSQLPALSVYEPMEGSRSRFFPENPQLIFDVYFPISVARNATEKVFNTISQLLRLTMQQPEFFYNLGQFMVPLPNPSDPTYNNVVTYKAAHGCCLTNFGQNWDVSSPVKNNIAGSDGVADAWKMQLKTTYQPDLANFYAMIESFGINFGWDANEIVYPPLDDFSLDVQLESAL